jgi:cytoskeletal protein CcmA (bactofilin family)
MNDTPRRRLLDRLGGTPSLLAEGCIIVGDVETPGALICGASVRGFAAIAGRINGSITVSDRLEIAASAVIRGRVAARSIAMARGATIDGDITVTGDEPPFEFEEKRHSS